MADRTPTITIMRKAADDATTPGGDVVTQEGESCNLRFVPTDMAGNAILKANLITLTLKLFDVTTSVTVNGRGPTPQNVLDANNGTVDTAGVLTMRLQPADNAIVGTVAPGRTQVRGVELAWTWNDGVAERTGKSDPLGYEIQKLAAVT